MEIDEGAGLEAGPTSRRRRDPPVNQVNASGSDEKEEENSRDGL